MILRAGLPFALAGMSVGLLGGSFDPAHEGHLHITEMALRRFRLDRVWWLVTPGNPLKAHGPAPLAERIAQARRMVHDPHVEITDIEARLGTRMTRDTLAALQRLYPRVRFVWLMGADNLAQFHRWDRWHEIMARVPVGVLARPGSGLRARLSPAAQIFRGNRLGRGENLAHARAPAWVFVNVPMNSASSSAIRAKGAWQPSASP